MADRQKNENKRQNIKLTARIVVDKYTYLQPLKYSHMHRNRRTNTIKTGRTIKSGDIIFSIISRERWSQLLDKRREYLNSQIQQYINKLDKTEVKQTERVGLVA